METRTHPPETLPAIVRRALAQPQDAVLLGRVAGAWAATSSEQLLRRVSNLACAIRDAGLSTGDRVALIAQNSVDWIVADFATLFAGCVVVPIFSTQALDQVRYILGNSEAKLIFVDTLEAERRLRTMEAPLPRIVVFEGEGSGCLAAFESHGAEIRVQHPELPDAFEAALQPDDLAVLIYTSGTTGQPKGVMLSHDNLGSNAQGAFDYGLGGVERGAPVLSVLPLSHIYEHCMLYGYMIKGVSVYVCHNPDDMLADLRDAHPVVVTAVPRIFERLINGIKSSAKAHGGAQAKLVPWALDTGRDYMLAKVQGPRPGAALSLRYRLAWELVLRKIRPALGLDKLLFFVSGSAPLHLDTAMTMLACDITILEGYGLTECSPVVTASRLEDHRYGTVGKALPGVQIKIAEDGEILTKGPNVMKGYYKDPEATAAVFEDGWFETGDIGAVDADGYVRITDRKRELFKTSGGKFVAPARVESAIKRSVYVNQVLLVGYGRPHPAALVLPNWDLLRREFHLSAEMATSEIAAREDVQRLITEEVRRTTSDLASYEQVRRVVVLPRDLTVERGELSPTLKVRRRVVEDNYAAEIERVYRLDLHEPPHA